VRLSTPVLVALLALVPAACGGEDQQAADGEQAAQPPAEQRPPAQAGGCTEVAAPEPRPEGDERGPRGDLDPDRSYALVVKTNCGPFTIALDPEAAPNAAASLVSLAREDFFDATIFHRIVPGFVIQGGDPTAAGSGGPGYDTRDRPSADARYTKGTVAMAKAGDEPAGTAGSQFFVVTGDDVGLPPDYAVVGEVTEGVEVVDRIGALGDPATEQPTRLVVIEDVVVRAEAG